MTSPIPSPTPLPFLGNVLSLRDEDSVPMRAVEKLADVYGPIFKLKMPGFYGNERIFVANVELLAELSDEQRFWKSPPPSFQDTSKVSTTRGLFTAPSEHDPDWQQAHRILLPAFGPLAMHDMFDEMYDISSQLVLKWARMGPDYKIPVTGDLTRLTLDTIALCAMDFRFNSFYQDEMHPFITAMNNNFEARQKRAGLSNMLPEFITGAREKMAADRKLQEQVAQEMVQRRKDNPNDKKDLLNAMLKGKDPKTGEGMRDELIAANMITFLIAGHETTSGLLSFTFFELLKNPSSYFKAQQEVDRVVGTEKIKVDHLRELKYIDAVLRETLRLHPTVPAFARAVRPESPDPVPTLGKGEFALDKDKVIIALVGKAQRDPAVFGEDADEFRPERMLDGGFENLPSGAWKPFGTGVRGCIGRAFAWQEALLAVALILQNLNLRMDDANYDLRIKQTLTMKPKDFYMRATVREGRATNNLTDAPSKESHGTKLPHGQESRDDQSDNSGPKAGLSIFYGSNTGTCQALAQRLALGARQRGFEVSVADLNSAVDKLSPGQPTVILTASYEGQPTDNANQFVAWLESMDSSNRFRGVKYAVFGCGHSDWAQTFQRIPRLIDNLLDEHTAERLVPRGYSDAAKGNIFGDFESWLEGSLWPNLISKSGTRLGKMALPGTEFSVEVSTEGRASHLQQDVRHVKVLSTKLLTSSTEPEKRHLEVQLPTDMTYEAGDYLAVLPLNPDTTVQKVFDKYSLPWDAVITVKEGGPLTIPTNVPISASDLFKGYVELSNPAAKRDIQTCLEHTSDAATAAKLNSLLTSYPGEVAERRISLLNLLTSYPTISLPLSTFLTLLPPMRPRHYSISSSPLQLANSCTITYSVIDEPSLSGQGRFLGVAGSYLKNLKEGDHVQVSVRSTNKFFRLPADVETTPIVMFCAGTGLAPLRGFLQERAVQKHAGRKLAPALLFIGCRSATADRLYADEIDAWSRDGVVDVRYAFSRESNHELAQGCKYVQDRMLKDRSDLSKLWDTGAKVYVCGSSALATGVEKAARETVMANAKHMGQELSEEEVSAWLLKRRNERFVTDIFG